MLFPFLPRSVEYIREKLFNTGEESARSGPATIASPRSVPPSSITAYEIGLLRQSSLACELADAYSMPMDAPGRAERVNRAIERIVRATKGSALRETFR